MAYVRWSETSDWYIFWHASDAIHKAHERVAAWHSGTDSLPQFTYIDVKGLLHGPPWDTEETLAKSYPGVDLSDEDRDVLKDCLQRWVEAVDQHYKEKYTKKG